MSDEAAALRLAPFPVTGGSVKLLHCAKNCSKIYCSKIHAACSMPRHSKLISVTMPFLQTIVSAL